MLTILGYIFLVNGQETSINQLDKNNEKTGSWIGYHEKTNTKRYTGNFLNGKPTGIFNYYALEVFLQKLISLTIRFHLQKCIMIMQG